MVDEDNSVDNLNKIAYMERIFTLTEVDYFLGSEAKSQLYILQLNIHLESYKTFIFLAAKAFDNIMYLYTYISIYILALNEIIQ